MLLLAVLLQSLQEEHGNIFNNNLKQKRHGIRKQQQCHLPNN
jgi:hypothetical protein